MQSSMLCSQYYLFDSSGQIMIAFLFVKYVTVSQKRISQIISFLCLRIKDPKICKHVQFL